jgi:hypothetical protein
VKLDGNTVLDRAQASAGAFVQFGDTATLGASLTEVAVTGASDGANPILQKLGLTSFEVTARSDLLKQYIGDLGTQGQSGISLGQLGAEITQNGIHAQVQGLTFRGFDLATPFGQITARGGSVNGSADFCNASPTQKGFLHAGLTVVSGPVTFASGGKNLGASSMQTSIQIDVIGGKVGAGLDARTAAEHSFTTRLEMVRVQGSNTSLAGASYNGIELGALSFEKLEVMSDLEAGATVFDLQAPQVDVGGFGFDLDGVVLEAVETMAGSILGPGIAETIDGATEGVGNDLRAREIEELRAQRAAPPGS